MAITAALVKELRDRSGAGMMDAKKALVENDGDMETAIDWLRTKGLAKAAKKSGRTAAEGLVGIAISGSNGAAIEINSETDFVAKNADFQRFVASVSKAALDVDDMDALKSASLNGRKIEDALTDKIATIGENMTLRRMRKISGDIIVSYVHNAVVDNMGKIGVLVALKGHDTGIGKQIAMHIAATNPLALSQADIDPAILEKERSILGEQARESGKPAAVTKKMIEGRMRKYIAEVTLLGQNFVINPDITVQTAAKEAGVEITDFVRLETGEGIEKEAENFADEVAKMSG